MLRRRPTLPTYGLTGSRTGGDGLVWYATKPAGSLMSEASTMRGGDLVRTEDRTRVSWAGLLSLL
jgi:hypothetical protein